MKLIDKYMLRTFLVPFFYCFLAFVLIFVIFDLFDNLGDFVEGKTPMVKIALYYAILMPSIMVRIVPVSLLLAVLYALSALTKNNELTAMRASGISLLRLMLPLVLFGLLSSLVVAAIEDSLGPRAAYWCHRFVREQRNVNDSRVSLVRQFAFKNAPSQRVWMVNEFSIRDQELRGVEVTQQRPDGSDAYVLKAKNGRWVDGRWWFSDLSIQKYDDEGNPDGPPEFALTREMSDYQETPDSFLSEIKDPQHLSAKELRHYIETHQHLPDTSLARLQVDLHARLALPWASLIVTLFGIPFGAQTGRKGAFVGVSLSIGLFFAYYSLIVLGQLIGKRMLVDAWIGGWLPNMVFLGVGAIMVYRMR